MQVFAGVSADRMLIEGLKVSATNHRILANNIANADTPRFAPTELDFQATLRRALEGRDHVDLRTTQVRHLEYRSHRPKFEGLAFLSKNDYNAVDLDDQLAKLAENRGRYVTYSALLTKQYRSYRTMLDNLR
ncbi:MAG TPA: flagellar basal body rod protein FlgB [Candidatus Hydrogenedentes bacterium]|nr:flagellar basal body rod protein FlgB [Candidatus Hydrogenedentota bacterium]HNT87325.1 flagellar basal body rod protein FlgB [Candidatus Hydrogenedentota bacterium]